MSHNLRSSENGYLLLPMDRNSHPEYLIDEMVGMSKAELIETKCTQDLFCGMPFYTTRMLRQSTYSYWIPADQPYFNKQVSLTRIVEKQPVDRFMFELTGTDAMGVMISPMPGIEIVKWSFFHEVTETGMDYQGRPTYFVFYSAGINAPGTFWVDLKVPNGWIGKKLDIGIAAHYTHFDKERTEAFQSFIDSYPKWTHVTAWMASYNGFEY